VLRKIWQPWCRGGWQLSLGTVLNLINIRFLRSLTVHRLSVWSKARVFWYRSGLCRYSLNCLGSGGWRNQGGVWIFSIYQSPSRLYSYIFERLKPIDRVANTVIIQPNRLIWGQYQFHGPNGFNVQDGTQYLNMFGRLTHRCEYQNSPVVKSGTDVMIF
jgi:hypothetical protein